MSSVLPFLHVEAKPRRSPYTWATWLTAFLAGDASCFFQPWFQSRYTFDKVDRGGFDLAQWKVAHAGLVDRRATELRQAGSRVFLEDQNKFTIQGTSTTLAGKPDIVAVTESDALVVDCKTGQRKGADVQQVLLYLYALPLYHQAVTPKHRLTGEVRYPDGAIAIMPDQITQEVRDRITMTLKRIGDSTPPAKVPSSRECNWCPIPKHLCPERIETPESVVRSSEF